MNFPEIYSATGMIELIQKIGFLPLLDSGIEGFSAEDIVAEDCGYVRLPEGGWDWPLWKWKGEIVQEMPCMYRKFFNKKAGFISQEWWPDFCNYRRSKFDGYLTRLEMATYIVTEDFIYPRDKHNHEYGWVGRCSILPKISMAGRLANATALPRNLIRGFLSIRKKSCLMLRINRLSN